MFRLESYITPILINYVAKYVKNIRPEDAQVSLWEGEVTFHNLELNLDVLQAELNLPVEFLSGHIHDLSILVPWTKIYSEPVRITINTIEFVLKLKDKKTTSCASSTNSSPQRQHDLQQKQGNKQDDQIQVQQYTGQGLVNRIIDNIVINCHNIILKYIEEDIVVSMNVQLLSVQSANNKWHPAVVDIHPIKVIMRKLITISDLTICLDKRNEAGRIDISQEPILYRCTLEIRIMRKYDKTTSHKMSTTRVGIFTKMMDINVSSLQFPMAMRLFEILQNVKANECTVAAEESVEEPLDSDISTDIRAQGSVLTWAWNMLPSFNFETYENELGESAPVGHIFELSVYMEDFNFTLKHSEFITESIMAGAKRIRYSPIVRIHLTGIYFELMRLSEQEWTNMKGGVSGIQVEPLATFRHDEKWGVTIVESAKQATDVNSFKDKSLFDDTVPGGDQTLWNVTNFKVYSERFTDEYLAYRTPVLAFDMVEYISLINKADLLNSNTTSDLSGPSSYNKSVQYRFMMSGVKICYSQALQQVGNVIIDYIKSYDYSAYHTAAKKNEDKTPLAKLPPPIMEDYDALMLHVPRCKYQVKVFNLTVECHVKVEPENATTAISLKTFKKLSTYGKMQMPFLCLKIRQAELQLISPLKPDILVHTTCQLPNKPFQLLNACNESYNLEMHDLELLLFEKIDRCQAQLLHVPKLKLNYGNLLKPHLWAKDNIALQKSVMNIDSIRVKFSKRQLLLTQALVNSVLNYEPQLLYKFFNLVNSKPDLDAIKVVTNFLDLKLTLKIFHTYKLLSCNLGNLKLEIWQEEAVNIMVDNLFYTFGKNVCNKQNAWLEVFIQLADKKCTPSAPNIFLFWLNQYQIQMDHQFIKFFLYQETKPQLEREISNEPDVQNSQQQIHTLQSNYTIYTSQQSSSQRRRPSRSSAHTRKISQPEETVHFSSERDERFDVDNSSNVKPIESSKVNNKTNWWEFMYKTVVQVDVAEGNLLLAPEFSRQEQQKTICDYTQLALPKLNIHSSSIEYQKREDLPRKLNIQLPEKQTSWIIKLSNLGLLNCYNGIKYEMLANAQTTITAAFVLRSQKFIPKTKHSRQEQNLEQTFNKSVLPKINFIPQKIHNSAAEEICTSDNEESTSLCGEAESENDHSAYESDSSFNIKKSEQPKLTENIICINLHADTPPIHIVINAKRLLGIYEHLNIIFKLLELSKASSTPMPTTNAAAQQIQIVTPTEINASLKEFIDMESISEISFRAEKVKTDGANICLFCQWTVAKVAISVEEFCMETSNKCKIVFELEDLLSTIDQHDTYTKCTGKVGHLNLGYYEWHKNEEWKPREYLQIKVLSEISRSPFINVIITTAAVGDYYKRVGIKRNGDVKKNITEIVVDMMALEITLDMDKLFELRNSLCIGVPNKKLILPKIEKTKTPSSPMTAQNMPMIHFNSKGFTIYIPLRSAVEQCSVLIWKIENIKVTPNLDNPLQRNPVRTDVFYKAAQMGILGLPGSCVEDRQYEFTLKHISAATGNWQEILLHLRSQDNDFLRSNPAFEWNNQNQRTQVQFTDIFTKFTFSIIFAPFITYNNVLICGQAIEFNCTNDFVANFNMEQLKLITAILSRFQCISK